MSRVQFSFPLLFFSTTQMTFYYKNNSWTTRHILVPFIILWVSTLVITLILIVVNNLLINLTYTLYFFWDVVLYILIPTFVLLLSFGVVLSKNPINSLFCLIGVFFNTIILLFTIRVEFLSMILLIIYLGAIAILFLFVIMLLNLRNLEYPVMQWTTRNMIFTSVIFALGANFYYLLTQQLYIVSFCNRLLEGPSLSKYQICLDNLHYYLQLNLVDIYLFSNLLYDKHAALFLLSAMLLLVSMVGAIVLAMSTLED